MLRQIPSRALNSSPPPSSSVLDAEKISPFVLAVIIAYAAVKGLCQASIKPLWYDEICTLIVARQQHLSTMWSALKQGADGQPPGFYLIERVAIPLVANEHISFRLLSILGFLATILCLFVLIRKSRGSAVALFCASIPLTTILYENYSVEARPYSLVIACIAFALVCYQRAPSVRWMILLGLSLALAQSFGYYAALAFLPFIAAELVLLLVERKLRGGVWLALGCGFLPLAVFWPLLSLQKTIYGQHFWVRPSLLGAESSYGWYFHETFATGIVLVAGATLAVLGTILFQERRAARGESPVKPSLHEPTLILAILGLPFVGLFAAMLSHGPLTARYVFPTVLGFPLAAGYALPRLRQKSAALFLGFTLVVLAVFLGPPEKQFWSLYHSDAHFVPPTDVVENLVRASGHGDLPVVVSDAHDFLQLRYYASPDLTPRLVSLADAPQAVAYMGNDTADKELPILAHYFPLQVYDFQTFAAKNPVFLLYSGNGGQENDWWPRKLTQDGYTLRPVGVRPVAEHDYLRRVFLVSRLKDSD